MITAKKSSSKKRPASKRTGRSKQKNTEKFDLAKDEAERIKIGKTLDVAAFMRAQKKNAAAIAKYWEEPE